ncbi:MAG: hypothetical protein M1840_002442 [Geoglossum simile]|nr:MAG: hypothetical protein M1840_002442 [Geoglossum simile]
MMSKRKVDSQGCRDFGVNGRSTGDSMQQSSAAQLLNRPKAKAVRRRALAVHRQTQGQQPPSDPQQQIPLPAFSAADVGTTISSARVELALNGSPGLDNKALTELLLKDLPQGPVNTSPFSVMSTPKKKEPEPDPFSIVVKHLGNYRDYGDIAGRSPSHTIVNGDFKVAPAVGRPVHNPTSPTIPSPTSPTYNQTLPISYVPTSPTMYNPTMSKPTSPTYSQTLPTSYVPTSPTMYNPTMSKPTSPTYSQTLPTSYVPTSPTMYNPAMSRPTSPTYSQTLPTSYIPTSPTMYSPAMSRPTSPTYSQTLPTSYVPTSPTMYNPAMSRPTSPTYSQTLPTSYVPTSPTMYNPAISRSTSPTYSQTLPATYSPTSPAAYNPVSPTVHNGTSQTRCGPSSPTSNVGLTPDIFIDKQLQGQDLLNEEPTMPLGEIPLPNSETETLTRNALYPKCPSGSAPQVDSITKVQSTNLPSSSGQDITKNQGTRQPLPTPSLSGTGGGGAESTKPQLPRKIVYPGKSFAMSPTRTGRAIIPEPPKATTLPNQTTVETDISNQHFELSRVLGEVPNIPVDFSEPQKQMYVMQYRIRSLNVAFKEATSSLNLASAADWKPWIQLRDDICEKILEAGSRSLKRKPDMALDNNGKRAHTGAEQVKGTSKTAGMFGNILKQGRGAKRVFEGNAPKSSEPSKSTDTVSTPLQSNTSAMGASVPSVLKLPTFGPPVDFSSQFAKAAEETAKRDKAKRKAEEFDSEEEDEDAREHRDSDVQPVKKKKIEEEIEDRTSKFVPGEGLSLTPTPTKPIGVFSALTPPVKTSKGGLFDRISVGKDGKPMRILPTDTEQSAKTPPASDKGIFGSESNGTNGVNAFGFTINPPSDGEKSTKSTSTGSTPILSGESNTTSGVNAFGFKINPPSDREELTSSAGSTPTPSGESNSTNAFGFNINPTSQGERPTFSTNPFALSSNSPFNGEKPAKSPSASHLPTFGGSSGTNAFGFNFNPPSNGAKSTKPLSTSHLRTFGNRSGTNTFAFSFNPSSGGEKPSSTSNIFGGDGSTDPVTSAGSIFQTGGLLSVKPTPKSVMSLSTPAVATSSNTSRATTPGATTDAGDSTSESMAEGEIPKSEDDSGRIFPGESDEDVIFQVKARPYEFIRKTGQYEKRNAGRFRVLKHRATGKTRIVHRTNPLWNVLLNAALLPTLRYEASADNSVRIIIASEDGALKQWKMKVLKKEDAAELARVLNENAPPVEPAGVLEKNESSTEPAKLSKEG